MTLQQCRYLIEIAKYGSISKAANELFVTQPSITKAIHELESDLDIIIFERSNRGVSFTGEGLELLSYARLLIAQEETIRCHFNRAAKSGALNLSIASQHFSFATEAFSRLLEYLGERKYELSFLEGKGADVIERVASGISMLGVFSMSSISREYLERNFIEQSLVFTAITTLPIHVFLKRSHPLASCASISPQQLAGYPNITYRKDDTSLTLTEDYVNLSDLSRLVYVQDRATMDELLLRTDGYNIGTGCVSGPLLASQLTSVPLSVPMEIHIGYIKRSSQVFPEEILKFIEFLTEAVNASIPG